MSEPVVYFERIITAAVDGRGGSPTYSLDRLTLIEALARNGYTQASALVAERDALRKVQEWQPMATAPHDGTSFIASYQWLGEPRYMVIRRSDQGEWWVMCGMNLVVGDKNSAYRFTHWQPIGARAALSPEHQREEGK
jgi:hypothetical protein